MVYSLTEVFDSIQGEGFHAGRRAIFVRFAGCNLSCSFCDTDHRERMHATGEQIVRAVLARRTKTRAQLVVLTGGEPTLQPIAPLVEKLCRCGERPRTPFRVAIETNGEHWESLAPLMRSGAWITWSPKRPFSRREMDHDRFPCLAEIKVVAPILDGRAGHLFRLRLEQLALRDLTPLYIQPCSGEFGPAVQFVKEHPQWILSVQMHKVFGIA
jgi:7-carboxy-7-deazaguanine synthase